MAEGFLLPTDGSGSHLEEAGEDYFFTLVQRWFFQDLKVNKLGNIESCKIHDLLHDLAQKVAGDEIHVAKLGDTNLKKRIRRLSLGYRLSSTQSVPSCVLDLKHLRTFLLPEQVQDGSVFSKSICHQLISNFRCLRVLDLNNLGVEILPSSIGKLIHLRYLNLSHTRLRTLPSSITDLQNLQTLDLSSCFKLISLPKDIRKLTNLRRLDVDGCHFLRGMPLGMTELTSLHKLNRILVKNEHPSHSRSACAQLRDLKNLNSLKGYLNIYLDGELKDPAFEAKEANLSSKLGLNQLEITKCRIFDEREPSDRVIKHDEAILEGLKPHHKLKMLMIRGWNGRKLPSWAVMDNLCNCLPDLVEISLEYLSEWQQLPSFGHLNFLKRLCIQGLKSVEFMESTSFLHNVPLSVKETPLFFPSLEKLSLIDMNGLKGWWKYGEEGVLEDGTDEEVVIVEEYPPSGIRMSFPKLACLNIDRCPNLKSIPICPKVKDLTLVDVDETLSVLKMAARASSKSSLELKSLCIDNVQDLISLPKECLQQLSSLTVQQGKLQSTRILQEVYTSLPSLRCLKFSSCDSLKCGTAGLEHLTALEELGFWECSELDLSASGYQGQGQWQGAEDEDGMPWKALNNNLRSLKLFWLDKMEALPHGIQYLTNLRSLHISFNYKLKELPEWIGCLSSLEYFHIIACDKLKSLPEEFRQLTNLKELEITCWSGLIKRCRGPTGEDWPKIQHIPHVFNSNCD